MTDDHGVLTFGLSGAERDIDAVMQSLRDMRRDLIEPVARKVLPKLGEELADMAHRDAPRAYRHRGPGKGSRAKDKWRHPFIHAADTIRVSRVMRDKETGSLMVVVGPQRGDNSPSFYLKFMEYGTMKRAATPFLRPARRVVMDQMAVPMTVEAINEIIKKEGSK